MSKSSPMIQATGLAKRYGSTAALVDIDLAIPEGTVFAMLGPNGAGKTTTVRILTTLAKPDAGSATVAGFDLLQHPMEVRRRIGVTGQYATLDELLTGRENLELIGRLYRLSARDARSRATALLEQFDLVDAAGRLVKTYSGGMRRRLDLASSLMASPPVLFLDEPTTGLDPRSRLTTWEVIKDLIAQGTTLFLTTQYLEEADYLADEIAVVDRGRILARGSADELKGMIGGEQLLLTLAPGSDLAAGTRVLATFGSGPVSIDASSRQIGVSVTLVEGLLTRVTLALNDARIAVDSAELQRPTLDDVFLSMTGQPASANENDTERNVA